MISAIGPAAEKCRKETRARLPKFRKKLGELLPHATFILEPPEEWQLAATANISLRHTKGARVLEYQNSGGGALIARLSDLEKTTIADAVGVAAHESGLEVLFKPKWSDQHRLAYRLFFKE